MNIAAVLAEDKLAGKAKQVKGKANDIAGAVKGDTGQQIKGKCSRPSAKFRKSSARKLTDHFSLLIR